MAIDISVRERHREQSHSSFPDICEIAGGSHHLIPRSASTSSDEETRKGATFPQERSHPATFIIQRVSCKVLRHRESVIARIKGPK